MLAAYNAQAGAKEAEDIVMEAEATASPSMLPARLLLPYAQVLLSDAPELHGRGYNKRWERKN
jgi:hypothetical protein